MAHLARRGLKRKNEDIDLDNYRQEKRYLSQSMASELQDLNLQQQNGLSVWPTHASVAAAAISDSPHVVKSPQRSFSASPCRRSRSSSPAFMLSPGSFHFQSAHPEGPQPVPFEQYIRANSGGEEKAPSPRPESPWWGGHGLSDAGSRIGSPRVVPSAVSSPRVAAAVYEDAPMTDSHGFAVPQSPSHFSSPHMHPRSLHGHHHEPTGLGFGFGRRGASAPPPLRSSQAPQLPVAPSDAEVRARECTAIIVYQPPEEIWQTVQARKLRQPPLPAVEESSSDDDENPEHMEDPNLMIM